MRSDRPANGQQARRSPGPDGLDAQSAESRRPQRHQRVAELGIVPDQRYRRRRPHRGCQQLRGDHGLADRPRGQQQVHRTGRERGGRQEQAAVAAGRHQIHQQLPRLDVDLLAAVARTSRLRSENPARAGTERRPRGKIGTAGTARAARGLLKTVFRTVKSSPLRTRPTETRPATDHRASPRRPCCGRSPDRTASVGSPSTRGSRRARWCQRDHGLSLPEPSRQLPLLAGCTMLPAEPQVSCWTAPADLSARWVAFSAAAVRGLPHAHGRRPRSRWPGTRSRNSSTPVEPADLDALADDHGSRIGSHAIFGGKAGCSSAASWTCGQEPFDVAAAREATSASRLR